MTALELAKATLAAYVAKDRATVERLLADDFHFTSPWDNRLDRGTYFRICWPNSEQLTDATVVHSAEVGNRAFIVYEVTGPGGRRFRNAEMHVERDGKLAEVEVYFGWNLPHPVAEGTHDQRATEETGSEN